MVINFGVGELSKVCLFRFLSVSVSSRTRTLLFSEHFWNESVMTFRGKTENSVVAYFRGEV